MPRGTVTWFDPKTGEGRIAHAGQTLVVRAQDLQPAARAAGARVRFDLRREHGTLRAHNARLLEGTRQSPRQGRFGDLVGAKRPDHKGRQPLTHGHPDLQPGPGLPSAVARRWIEAMKRGDPERATALYAPDAVLHTELGRLRGHRQIHDYLSGSPLLGSPPWTVEIHGDKVVLLRWTSPRDGGPRGTSRLRVRHGEIAEQWITPGR
jgi:cold shock CspA family protein